MGIAVSLIIAAVGLILALAVHPANPGSVDVNTVGWILFVIGLFGMIIDLVLWSSLGPGYLRRRTVYANRAAPRQMYPARRRRVVEDVVDEPPPGY